MALCHRQKADSEWIQCKDALYFRIYHGEYPPAGRCCGGDYRRRRHSVYLVETEIRNKKVCRNGQNRPETMEPVCITYGFHLFCQQEGLPAAERRSAK